MTSKKLIVLFFTIIVGLIYSLENILPYFWTKNTPGQVFTVFNGGDENLYAAQAREVYEGKLSGNAFIWETKNQPIFSNIFLPWLGTLFAGFLVRVFHSLDWTFVLGDFVFPGLIFILLVNLAYKLTNNFYGSITVGLATLFLSPVTTKLPPINMDMWQGLVNILTFHQSYQLIFSTLITRQLSFLIFVLFLFSLYFLFQKSLIWTIAAGMTAGILAYFYGYYWTTALVILGAGMILAFLNRDYLLGRNLLIALLIALGVSSLFLINFYNNLLSDNHFLSGKIHGRFIEPLTTIRYGFFCLISWYLLPKNKLRFLSMVTFLAAVILMNLQLLLGFSIDPGHWPNSVFEPLLVFFIGAIFFFLVKSRGFVKVLPLLIILFIGVNQFASAKEWLSFHQLSTTENNLFNWLNKYAEPESVVLTLDKRISRYLPVATAVNLYLPYGPFSQLSLDNIWLRIDLAFSILGFQEEQINQKLLDTQFVGQMFEQAYNYEQTDNLNNLDFPDSVKEEIKTKKPIFSLGLRYIPDNIKNEHNQVVKLLNKTALKDRLCRYRLDYVLFTPKDKINMHKLDTNYFLPVFSEDSYSLYKLINGICL